MDAASQREDRNGGILEGLRVLDLADEKGSYCSKLLADLGARVIKVEKPGGESSRRIGPFLNETPHPEESLFFFCHNTNKLGITLDLEHEEGKKIFLRLAMGKDVMIETFPPGYLKKIGLGFDVLKERNPNLIWVSITGFGQTGPRCHEKSCDLVAAASGGQMFVTGSPTAPPLKPFGEQTYLTASLFAAVGILLTLRRRAQTGRGEHLDLSLQESAVSTLDHVMVRYFYEKLIPRRQGGTYGNQAFFILPCKDGHILLAPFQQWETLVGWMEGEGMAEDLVDKKYNEEAYRLLHLDHILEILKRWTGTHSKSELFESGQLMRFPWAPVLSPKEVVDNPQLRAREFFSDVQHPELNRSLSYPGLPFKSSISTNRLSRAPLIGEDNVRIYQEELGLSEEELKRLSSMGVI
jgi:benzylsuccinate CoA-transferase BbsE subunit